MTKTRSPTRRPGRRWLNAGLLLVGLALLGCQPQQYRQQADKAAAKHIDTAQKKALGQTEPFTIDQPSNTLRRRLLNEQNLQMTGPASFGADRLEPPKRWPEKNTPKRQALTDPPVPPWNKDQPVRLSLRQALMVAGNNNRSYQDQKESVFRTALDVELELDQFRNTYTGLLDSLLSTDQAGDTTTGFEQTAEASVTRTLKQGATLSQRLVFDLAQLLSNGGDASAALFYDGSIQIPLLRGAGEHIVAEPLTQAKRNLIYDIWDLQRFRRQLVVDVVGEYLSVLQAQDRVMNAEQNYKNLVVSQRRAQALFEADQLDRVQLDQNRQQVLSARDRWIREQDNYARQLDAFKQTLGLPTDARIRLDREELDRLAASARERLAGDLPQADSAAMEDIPAADAPVELEQPSSEGAGPFEMPPRRAIGLALENRRDLQVQKGQVYDAQRNVIIAADALEAGLTLTADAQFGERRSLGSAGLSDGDFTPSDGFYSTGLLLDLPLERTAESLDYRDSYINLTQQVRDVQSLEDEIKFNLRDQLRILQQQRQSYQIQAVALEVARRQAEQTSMFLEEGRAGVEIRDVLEAEADLLQARNAVTAALVEYRVAELALQRDMGVLQVTEKGLYDEFTPQSAG
jgi:outer membrane protein TolC